VPRKRGTPARKEHTANDFADQRERFAAINHCQPVTPLFKGRRQILERLSAYFCARSGEGRQRREFLLYGMGGSGKSQIALKFADEYGKRSVLP
jgi:Holliday junction resolvasome RuvABC ATP-dependent DNA helicase subunit